MRDLRSVDELDSGASIVVVAEPQAPEAVPPNGVNGRSIFTRWTLKVDRVVRGKLAADVVAVRQLGVPGLTVEDSPPTFEPGRRYLLWLTPTQLPGSAGSDYYVVGAGAGQYVLESDGETATKQDRWSPDLPRSVRVSEVQTGRPASAAPTTS